MFEKTPRWCPCGCASSYTIEFEGNSAPRQGVWLHYSCPRSQERLSFKKSGPWASTNQEKKYKVVRASMKL